MAIDPHVHLRDFNQSYKETISHGLGVAHKIGLSGVFDMPNTDPAIVDEETVLKRLEIAKKVGSHVFYGLYLGLTSDEEQLKNAVMLHRKYFPQIVGFKLYAGHSVGNLAVIKEDDQKKVYSTLASEGYEGLIAVHCEKESELRNDLWNPKKPKTHSLARPENAEVESIKDQIIFAKQARFIGTMHICHVSSPKSVELINEYKKKELSFKITCGVTPHHALLNTEDIPEDESAMLFKVNPPIRDEDSQKKMLEYLKKGFIDWIETDHAPHTLTDKKEKYMSGFPGLPFYPRFIDYLENSEKFTKQQIDDLTHHNICKIFKIGLENKKINRHNDMSKEYEYNVYEGLQKWN